MTELIVSSRVLKWRAPVALVCLVVALLVVTAVYPQDMSQLAFMIGFYFVLALIVAGIFFGVFKESQRSKLIVFTVIYASLVSGNVKSQRE